MNNILKYLIFFLIGTIIYNIVNHSQGFSIGGPNHDPAAKHDSSTGPPSIKEWMKIKMSSPTPVKQLTRFINPKPGETLTKITSKVRYLLQYIFNHPNLFVIYGHHSHTIIQGPNPEPPTPDDILEILNPGDQIMIVNPLPGGAPIPFAVVPPAATRGFNLLYIGRDNVYALHYFHEIQDFITRELYRLQVGPRVTFHPDVDVCGTGGKGKKKTKDY